MFLQQFNFDIKYKQGSKHVNADVLSRKPSPTSSISVLTSELPLFTSVSDLIKAQKEDPQLARVRAAIEQGKAILDGPPGLRQCYIQDDILCRPFKDSSTGYTRTQFVIPQVLKEVILKEAHGLGHLGIKKTLDIVKKQILLARI